ncbi:50S ribosomal protein L30 [Halanaeroarchaeum sulfurireducens]|uniref:Large ribosomal subunit protein uL30 n=1 Tax=Halanaeroarchaeum sulfurireducens TaxID=1604004 RepID=A0A0F7PDH7_9EURY|nr:50S ribosomal protein L30 [Halanaeroarchaeum sulfurireducens]AKH98245.1 50S ribosomal protein L30P [Halanaeroarchaeum sulfurireducens]ALG82639.1 50S ribosomal protein L30P [Halanaeroarchaeum sulfurireducens]
MQAVVQLRGEVDMSAAVEDTLDMLNIHGVNHCALIPERDTYRGMITKVVDYVAVGEPSEDVLVTLLEGRAEPKAGRSADVDEEWVAENTDYDDFAALADALLNEETTLDEQGLSPTLRLHPPRGGHEGIKQPATTSGQLGTHTTEEIDELLTAMR